ncbi:MAG: NAD(P)H-binding protein [Sphingomonadales bacterium]
MRIFITGAGGFIGGYLVSGLLREGHQVIAGLRAPEKFLRRFPSTEAVMVDFLTDHDPAVWKARLAGCDALINAAGILHGSQLQAVHVTGPKAMFEGAVQAGVAKIVHISAVSADRDAGTAYALSKLEADDYLKTCNLDWTILRPSLVYAAGAYGGTALMRGLAALPLVIPLVGKGDQPFQPIHAGDVTRTVLQALSDPGLSRKVIEPVGPETLTLRDILFGLRAWLGLPPARELRVPLGLINLAAMLGPIFGSGPVNPTSVRQLTYGNVSDSKAFEAAVGWRPRSFSEALEGDPAQTQDIWHARAYFLAPLSKWVLAFLWLASGLIGLIAGAGTTAGLLQGMDLPAAWAAPLAVATSLLDLGLGVWLISGRWIGAVTLTQLLAVLAYTTILTLAGPELWLDPFGPLLKNIPILALILVYGAIGRAR